MSAVPRQIVGLTPKVKGLKGIKPITTSVYPVNSSGTTEFRYDGNNQIIINIPAYKGSWLDVSKTYLRFNFKSDAGCFPVNGIHPFNRLQLRVGNQVVEDIQSYSTISKMLSNMESICAKTSKAYRSGDYRGSPSPAGGELDDVADLKDYWNDGATVEHSLVSGLLSKDFQEHYIPVGFFNQSGGESMSLTLWLEDPNITCVRDTAGACGFTLSDVEMVMTVVEMPQALNDRLDKELYNSGKISLPFSTFRCHTNHIPQNSQNAELSINESAMDLEAVYTAMRKQNLPQIADYSATKKVDNLMFVGGHQDASKRDTDATFDETGKVKSCQWRYDTRNFPSRRLEMGARDTKNALLHTLSTLNKWDDDCFLGGMSGVGNGGSQWDAQGCFALVNSFKTSRDDYLNGLNSSATGAPLELSISLAKPAQEALRLESFAKSNYTLNITKGGQASVLNGGARETPMD
jgi:hypothetical protein